MADEMTRVGVEFVADARPVEQATRSIARRMAEIELAAKKAADEVQAAMSGPSGGFHGGGANDPIVRINRLDREYQNLDRTLDRLNRQASRPMRRGSIGERLFGGAQAATVGGLRELADNIAYRGPLGRAGAVGLRGLATGVGALAPGAAGALALGGLATAGVGVAAAGVAGARAFGRRATEERFNKQLEDNAAALAAAFGDARFEVVDFARGVQDLHHEVNVFADGIGSIASEGFRLLMDREVDPEMRNRVLASATQQGLQLRLGGLGRGSAANLTMRTMGLASDIAAGSSSTETDVAQNAIIEAMNGNRSELANLGIVVTDSMVQQQMLTEEISALASVDEQLALQVAVLAAIEQQRAAIERGDLEGAEGRSRLPTVGGVALAEGGKDLAEVLAKAARDGSEAVVEDILGRREREQNLLGSDAFALGLNFLRPEEQRAVVEGLKSDPSVAALDESGNLVNQIEGSNSFGKVILTAEELGAILDEELGPSLEDIASIGKSAFQQWFEDMQKVQRPLGQFTQATKDLRDQQMLLMQQYTIGLISLEEYEKGLRDIQLAQAELAQEQRLAQEDFNDSLADLLDTRNESLEDANERYEDSMEDLADATEKAQERILQAFKAQDRIDLGSIRNRSASFLINNARRQNELVAEAQAGRAQLQERGLSEAAIKELGLDQLTPEAVAQIRLLLQGSDEQLTELSSIFAEKGELAKNELLDPLSEMGEELAERQQDILDAHTDAIEAINERFKRAIDQMVEQAGRLGLTIPETVTALDDGATIAVDIPQAGTTPSNPDALNPTMSTANRSGGSSGPSQAQRQRDIHNSYTYNVTVQAQDPAELERKLQERQAVTNLTGGGHLQ